MPIISKELLSEVLGVYVRDGWYFDCELLLYTHDKILGLDENYHSQINIYELAHKCKEWAHSRNFMIQSYLYNTKARADLLSSCDVDEKFQADTEPEAVFRACEWILKDKR